ncbi:ribonuclease H-like domain-containing protein [Tanacetum coccineum]
MDLETAQLTTTAKLPTLKQGEYNMWRLRIEQYFQVQDYALWDVIENGNSFKPAAKTTTNVDGTSTTLISGPVTTEEKLLRLIICYIQTRFGGNIATKKTQKTLLKQMYENFNAPSPESLDSIFNRLQKIVSQLAILGENISQEDLNLKFLRILPSKWNTHVVVWRNKPDLDTMSFDDLYNNFKTVEQEVKGTTSSSSISPASTQVSTASTQVSTANLSDATVYAFLANQPNGSQLIHEDLEQIHEDDLEEMDLKWQLALLSMGTRIFFQKTGRKITINGSDTAGYDKSKVECFNCHKLGHFARECRGPRNQDSRNKNQDSSKRTINMKETSSKAMLAIDRAGFDWSFMADEEVPTDIALMDFSDSEFNTSEFNLANYKRGLPSVEEQLVFYKKNERVQQPEFEGYGPKTSKSVSEDTSNEVRESLDAPMVKKLVSDDKSEKKIVFPTVTKIEFVRPEQQEKPVRKPVKYPEMYRSQGPRRNQRNWNNQKSQQLGSDFVMYNKACFVCGSFDHVQANYNYHQKERVVSRNNYTRVNYNYSTKKAHPSAHRNMDLRVVLMKTGLRPLNTARPINIAHPKTIVYSARPMSRFSKSAQSTVKRPYQTRIALTNKNFSQKVNIAKGKFYTARPKIVNTARPNTTVVNDVRANQGHPQKEDQGYVDSGCSRHMTGNMSYLSDFKEYDEGYVTFGGGAKGGKITGKGTLKTGKLDFKDVYFVKELQFNIFSVSQMCDKNNSVLFTNTGCFVLSPYFKLADESQVLLKVPRKNKMYSVDMKNIVPKESLTCLIAKATLNESMLWHRRLGKTTQSLLFTWVFFLASKDKTSGILKSFITEIENLVDEKVKIIRCDNGTEFKNRVMSEFCEKKGIKREFSVARTPQQNGVAERRNRTLIEAARTMLADSKLPTTFWAEAVNTACYVQNKFDGKSDEGFFIGYSMNSKAFRVYNIRTRKVEENLHVRFLEDKPIIAGDGPKWLFDIDVLTKSMNYVPVVAGSSQDCILMPLWKDGSLFDSYSKNASNDEPQPSSDVGKKDDDGRAAKSSQDRRRARIVVSDDEEDLEDASKQGRKITQIDEDEGITLVQMGAQTQGRHGQDMEFETEVYTAEDISTAGAAVTTASVTISTASPPRVSIVDDIISTAETLVYIRRSASKDKGKGIMIEFKPEQTKTKLQQKQERLGYEATMRLQEQLDEEERQRIARVHEAARSFTEKEWEDIRARIEADEELAQRIQAEEREKYSKAEKARLLVDLINQRKRYFAAQKAEAKRNKPMTQA